MRDGGAELQPAHAEVATARPSVPKGRGMLAGGDNPRSRRPEGRAQGECRGAWQCALRGLCRPFQGLKGREWPVPRGLRPWLHEAGPPGLTATPSSSGEVGEACIRAKLMNQCPSTVNHRSGGRIAIRPYTSLAGAPSGRERWGTAAAGGFTPGYRCLGPFGAKRLCRGRAALPGNLMINRLLSGGCHER